MTDACIFCKIVSEEAKATIVYRDKQATAFRDIHPVAPTHILIVPNRHIESVGALEVEDEQLIGHLFTVARKLCGRGRDFKGRLPPDHQHGRQRRADGLPFSSAFDRRTEDEISDGMKK